jgi:hypothetical protein
MAENIEQNLDLAQILATLASLPKPEGQPQQDSQQPYGPGQSYQGYDAPPVYPYEQTHHYQQRVDPRLVSHPAPQHWQPAPRPQDRISSPLIDPATIIEWKQGLRCVSKIAAQNSEFASTVRKVSLTLRKYYIHC